MTSTAPWRSQRSLSPVAVAVAVLSLLVGTAPVGPAVAQTSPDEQPADEQSSEDAAVGAEAVTPTPPTARFVAQEPCRLADSRSTTPFGRGEIRTYDVTGCSSVVDPSAVSLAIAVVNPRDQGFLTLFPADIDLPNIANLNYSKGSVIANSATVRVADGRFRVFSEQATDVVIDVYGAFEPVTTSAPGRFVPIQPSRATDTRVTGERGDGDLTVDLSTLVPPTASAVSLSVTAVNTPTRSFVGIASDGPTTSFVNTDDRDRTRNAGVNARLVDGTVTFERSGVMDLVVDVTGFYTSDLDAEDDAGLFVAEDPTRLWDSRVSFDPLNPDAWRTLPTPGAGSAVVLNVAALGANDPSWFNTFPGGYPTDETSILNTSDRAPRSSLSIAAVSTSGVGVRSHAGAHMVVDRFGHFRGEPAPAGPVADDPSTPTAPRDVLFISDSSFAGIRWTGALPRLVGNRIDARLESCRRLIWASCRGREGYAPGTALSTLSAAPFGRYDALVIGTGYNDSAGAFQPGFDAIMATARQKGIRHVLWFSYRTQTTYVSPGALSSRATFLSHNAKLRAAAASGEYPELHVVDWENFSLDRFDWVYPDGVHFRPAGARAAADYLSDTLAWLYRQPCPSPVRTSTPGGHCAHP